MGRRNSIPDDYAGEMLHLLQVPFVDGCYDEGGVYWGAPANLWCAFGESETAQVQIFVRANSLGEARANVHQLLPGAVFGPQFTSLAAVLGDVIRNYFDFDSDGNYDLSAYNIRKTDEGNWEVLGETDLAQGQPLERISFLVRSRWELFRVKWMSKARIKNIGVALDVETAGVVQLTCSGAPFLKINKSAV